MEIEARLHVRADIDRIGIAPFSSMFWYGEMHIERGTGGRKFTTATDWRS